jgi:tetratricopeptide (TPR) repeat protein
VLDSQKQNAERKTTQDAQNSRSVACIHRLAWDNKTCHPLWRELRMSDPNKSDSLDETLAQPVAKPTLAPHADLTGDFSQWTWVASGSLSQPVSQPPSAPTESTDISSPNNLDGTLVQSMLAGKQKTMPVSEQPDQTLIHAAEDEACPVVTRVPDRAKTEAMVAKKPVTRPPGDELDQTLINAPEDEAPDTTDATLAATLLKPTLAPRRADTRAATEPDYTLVNPPEPSTDPHATECESAAPSSRITEPIGSGRPTGGPDVTAPLVTDKNARKTPSFQPTTDRYDILGTLGRGGMGVVYKALDKQLNRLVALKMILSGVHASAETLMRFKIEAEAVAKLQHPNIVQIFDSGVRDGHPFFSLEFLDGGSLYQQLQGKAQPPRQAAAIIEILARAIHYAHLRGIVHRDMKPANVLLASGGAMKITDFGLAKQLDVEEIGQTGDQAILGTPTYMAPEQAAGRTKDVGPAADTYALGAMLYEMLTGRPPFRGNTVMETLQQVQHLEPIQPRRLQPNAPLDLQTICLKCLNKEPNKRYASAEALADDLRAYLENRPIKARPTQALERLYKWMQRKPMQAALVAVCIAAGCGLIGGIVHNAQQQSELRQTAEDKAATELKARKDAESAAETIKEERDAKEVERARAVKNEIAANTNAEAARTNAARAQKNFTLAKEAVDRLTVLAQQNLADRPGLEKVRDDLLNRVVLFYEEFIKTNKDESLTLEKGQAYRRLGNIQQLLGNNDKAAVSYLTACDSYAALLAKDDMDETSRRELAETSLNLWTVLEDLGKQDEAGQALDQAHKEMTRLHAAFPDKAAYLLGLAMCENDYGIHANNANKLDPAIQHFNKALEYLSKAKDADATSPSFQLALARTNSNLGLMLTMRSQSSAKPDDDLSRAADLLAKALNSLKPLVTRAPETTDYARELGEVYTNLGTLQLVRKDRAGAVTVYTEAVELFDGLSKKYPDVTDYRHLLALNRSNRGDVLGQQKQFDAARTDLQAAADALTQLVAGFHNRPIYRVELARTCNRLGVIYEATGKRELAQQNWERAENELMDLVHKYPQRDDYRAELKRSLDFLVLFHYRDVETYFKGRQWPEAAAATARLLEVRERMAVLFPNEKTRGELASTRLHLAEMYVAARNTMEADKALTALWKNRKEIPRTWGQWHSAALVVCQLMELADGDPNLSAEARLQLRKTRTEQCLLMLRDAIDQNETIVIGPDDFKSLRNNVDFKELLTEIERKSKKAGEPQ